MIAAIATSALIPVSAMAASVSEITTAWAAGTPASSRVGEVVTAEVRINVNDDQAAPGNADVDNFTATFTTANGKFTEIPDICEVTGVSPLSSISADGFTLLCNLGTQAQGTALAVQVPIQVETRGEVTFDASVDGVTAPQLTHEVVTPFMMDLTLTGPSGIQTRSGDNRIMQFEWTLNWGDGGDVGPATASYVLTVVPTVGTLTNVYACSAFDDVVGSGHPNSGPGSAPERTAPTATCAITPIDASHVRMTLTDIDYSLAQVPTETSGGKSLPVDRIAVASGKFTVNVDSSANGSVAITADTPTYTSTNGETSVDDEDNNVTSKAWLNRGLWISSWNRYATGAGGSPFDDTYRVARGTDVRSSTYFDQALQDYALSDAQNVGLCTIIDSKYADYRNVSIQSAPSGTVPTGNVFRWYVGSTQAALDPSSASYDPGAISNCGQLSGGSWVLTEPTDKSTVQAVNALMPYGSVKNNLTTQMFVGQSIHADTPIGMDVWQFSNYFIGGEGWYPADSNAGVITPVADARYTHTNGYRDILRVVGVTPDLQKSVDSTVLASGAPATFTLAYSANGASAPATVDDYTIVDNLPAGLTYVAGSGSPEPVVTTDSGHQVLTWVLDGVATNAEHTISYQARANDSATPGQRLTNTATATVQSRTSAEASAVVTIAIGGRTIIGKSADQALIPNVAGDGVGSGSWTITLRSEDPTAQTFTDVIDILPYNGDSRGTSITGTYAVTDVNASGDAVYYSTATPGALSDDPGHASNGAAGDASGNTVGWTTTKPSDETSITAVRVIGGELLPGATRSFQIVILTDDVSGGDILVNRAQGRASHTELVMRTSAPTAVSQQYAYDLKKYVMGTDGLWHDAEDTNDADWPMLRPGATAEYKFVVTNTGQGDLADISVTDPLLGVDWDIASLDAGDSVESDVYEYEITDSTPSPLRNEACATAPLPGDSSQAELVQPCDEANITIGGYTVSKTSDPVSGSTLPIGGVIEYTVEVAHVGEADVLASFDDDLSAVMDDATYNGDAAATAGNVAVLGDTLSWDGALTKGDVVRVTYSVTVTGAGDRVLTNVVVPTTDEGTCVAAPDENADCTTTHRVPPETPISTGLAFTGQNLTIGGIAAGLLLLLGVMLVARRPKRESAL
ncbi:isopeptide-forming domain-containing fimbrial protein [Salinibacterium sp. M195]|uniref:isopeptide-forming domain-containing fimbrial protein n=1 Tax=Salinibacterium sp. M195 TaxID=2583374 RepID=UPI001C638D76|nr:isopeptide-forming domain-containing fimbrial protein [Salinibacterium sp. M195]